MIDELIERVERGEGAEQVIAAQQLGIHAVLAFMDALIDLIPLTRSSTMVDEKATRPGAALGHQLYSEDLW